MKAIYAILAAIIICATVSNAKDIYAENFGSVQDAINAAKNGDVVYVKGGIYNETLLIDKKIKLIGSYDNKTTVLNAGGKRKAIDIEESGVEVAGFTIKNAFNDIYINRSNNIILHDNVLTKSTIGINIIKSNFSRFYNNTIKDVCTAINIPMSKNNSVYGNRMINSGIGISVYNSYYIDIRNNYMEALCNAISLFNSIKNSIQQNNMYTIYDFGIDLWNSDYNKIHKNKIENCYDTGISIGYSENNVIYMNNVTRCWMGINTFNAKNNLIYLNNFFAENNHVDEQNVLHAKLTYKYKEKLHTGNLGNYWNDYNGVDANKDGIGDAPYQIPFATDRYPLMNPFENYLI